MKYIFATVLLALVSLQCSAGRGGTNAAESSGARPGTWIADRHIVALGVASDVRNNLPTDQLNNPVAQEIKRLTGITMEVMGASGGSSTEILAASAAAGEPRRIVYVLFEPQCAPGISDSLQGGK